MLVYLDNAFRCHVQQNAENSGRAHEVPELDGKCRTYVDGMRCVPEGETWTRADGEVFRGFMLTPWRDSSVLEAAQGAYEDGLAAARMEFQPQLDDVLVALAGGGAQ